MLNQRKGILLFVLSAPFAFGLVASLYGWQEKTSAHTQTLSELRLHLNQLNGLPVPGARVTVDGTRVLSSDANGVVTIQCQPEFHAPIRVFVVATGFEPQSLIIRDLSKTDQEIVLQRKFNSHTPGCNTVTAAELSAQAQTRSLKLQNQGLAAFRRKDYPTSEQLFREALELTPSSPALLNNIGACRARQNDLHEAERWFEKAVGIAPFNGVATGNLGLIRWMEGRREESYTLLQRASCRGFSTPPAEYVLGIMCLERGRSKEAADHLKKAGEDGFRYRDLYLSFALRGLGKLEAAMKCYKRFLLKNPVSLLP